MAKKAFETQTFTGFTFDPHEVIIVGVDCPAEDYPEFYDERVNDAISDSLVKNIMTFGVRTPPTVVKVDGKPIVKVGRKRFMAARVANERFEAMGAEERVCVRCVTERREDSAETFAAIITENELRYGDGMLRKADKAKKLLLLNGDNFEAVATSFGVSVTAIKAWMKLHDCCAAVRRAVDAGQVSPSAAVKLAGLPVDEQRVRLSDMLEGGDTTVAGATSPRTHAPGGQGGPRRGKKYWKRVIELLDGAGHDDVAFGIALTLAGETTDADISEYTGIEQILERAGETK